MDEISKYLMVDRRRCQMHNSKTSISRSEGFAVIIDKIKITGSYINKMNDLIHQHKVGLNDNDS